MTQDPNFKPVTKAELRRRATCKKRYGRAGLTIRRWGGFGGLVETNPLSDAVNAYRKGKTTAEEVAWAFVRSRIARTSPTFRWEDAELERLLELVVDCSESPHFESRDAAGIAVELVKAQDAEIERLTQFAQEIGSQLRRSFAGVDSLALSLAASPIHEWAVSQRRAFDSISKSLAAPSLSLKKILGDAAALGQFRALRSANVPRFELPPELAALKGARLGASLEGLVSPKASLLRTRLELPESSHRQLGRSLEELRRSARVQLPPSLLAQLAANPLATPRVSARVLTVGAVFEAAHATATEVRRAGGDREAAVLEAVTTRAEEVAASPSLDELQQALSDLAAQVEAGFSEQQARAQGNEEQRRRDREADGRRELVLCFVQIILSFYVALYFFWLGLRAGP